VRLLASNINFEIAHFGYAVYTDKPYNAIINLAKDSAKFESVEQLLDALLDHSKQPPVTAIEWSNLSELEAFIAKFQTDAELVAAGDEAEQDEISKR
jgi:putative ATP-dependent endonuclease of OLD family